MGYPIFAGFIGDFHVASRLLGPGDAAAGRDLLI